MNVAPDLVMALAQASGCPLDYRADGVVRFATERLRGEKEYFLETRSGGSEWTFVSVHLDYPEAQNARSFQRARFPGSEYRVVELLRRVLP